MHIGGKTRGQAASCPACSKFQISIIPVSSTRNWEHIVLCVMYQMLAIQRTNSIHRVFALALEPSRFLKVREGLFA